MAAPWLIDLWHPDSLIGLGLIAGAEILLAMSESRPPGKNLTMTRMMMPMVRAVDRVASHIGIQESVNDRSTIGPAKKLEPPIRVINTALPIPSNPEGPVRHFFGRDP